jgi:hypothetical protein
VTNAGLRESIGAERLFAAQEQIASLSWGIASSRFTVSNELRSALTVDDVQGWLECSLLQYPFFRMIIDGRRVPAPMIASPRSVGGQKVTGFIDADKVRDVFAQGGTLMLCNMHEWHAPCRQLCRSLTETLVADVKATAFYSPAGCRGLGTHRDDAHVFVAQLSGAKRWSVFDVPSDPQSRRIGSVDPAKCGGETTVSLRPGDGLYLPPYAAHHACAVPASNSLHLSSHVREPRARDVVDDAIERVMSAEMQRVEVVGDAAARSDQIGEILQSVGRRLLDLDPADLVEEIDRRITGR